MKKIVYAFAVLILSTIASVSCQREAEIGNDTELAELHFHVKGILDSKTRTHIIGDGLGTYYPYWNNGDVLGAFLGTGAIKDKSLDMTLTNTAADEATADFEGTAVAAGNGTFQAFYPASAFEKGYAGDERNIGLNIGDKSNDYKQHPAVSSPDPACDILLSKACDYISDGSDVVIDDLFFGRPLSVLKINLKGTYAAGEEVSWLKVQVSSGTLTGRVNLCMNTGEINSWTVSKDYAWAEYTSLKPVINHATNNTVYLVVNPTTIATGATVTFTASTDNYDIEKTITLTNDLVFPLGKIAVINLTIADANCTPKASPDTYGLIEESDAFEDGGQYILIMPDGSSPSTYYVLHSYRTLEASGLTPVDDVITGPDDKYIFIAEDGTESGKFALKNKSTGKYFPAASGTTTAASSDPVDIELTYLPSSYAYKVDLGDRFVAYYNTEEVRFYADANFVDQIAEAKILAAQKSGAFKVYKKDYTPKVRIATPANLSVTGMVVSWDAVSGAASYTVTVGETVVPGIATTSYTFDGPADYYNVSVVAVPSDPSSNLNSNPATLTGAKFGTPTLVTPVLANGGVTATTVTATWTDDARATNGYHCEIYNGVSKVSEQNVAIGVHSVTFTDLTEGTEYTVKVNAVAVTGAKTYVASEVGSINLTPNGIHVEDVTAAGTYTIEGLTVMAVSGNNVIAADATGAILIYKSGHGLVINDVFDINGTVQKYHGVWEFTSSSTITKKTTTTAIYPSPVTFDATQITSYASATVIVYGTATGTANSTAKTITVEEGKVLNVYGDLSAFDGKSVVVNGYAFGYNSSKVDFMLVGAPTYNPAVPVLVTSPVNGGTLEWDNDKYGNTYNKTIAVTINGAASGYTVSHSGGTVGDWNIADDGAGTLTYSPKAANTSSTTDKTLTVTVTHNDDGGLTSVITLVQKKIPAASYSATYKVTSKTSVSTTGTAPDGSTATYTQTYGTASQMTSGNSITLTLSGYDGKKIIGASVSVKSNSKGGSGSLSLTSGSSTIASISTAAFNTASWNGAWSTSYVDKELSVTQTTIGSGKTIVLTIEATANSLYFESLTLTYE